MARPLKARVIRTLIFLHRWMGVTLCLLFLLWFPSGIGMMYWEFPSVDAALRLERAPALDPRTIALSPADALAKVGSKGAAPTQVRLNTFDRRPVYRFGNGRGGGETLVYADTGEVQRSVSFEMVRRIASTWTGQPVSVASVTTLDDVDQWTVGRYSTFQSLKPLYKFAWPNGEEVYITGATGEVIQYTTTASRFGAWLGPIPHWIYFTPLRKYQPIWLQFIIWTSLVGTIGSLMGIIVGVWMLSPSRRYRHAGVPTTVPYRGQKRWHTIIGLVFGLGAATWAFSGMMSVNPFPSLLRSRPPEERRGPTPVDIQRALRGPVRVDAFAARHPKDVVARLAFPIKELELVSVVGDPYYLAKLSGTETRMVPVVGEPQFEVDHQRIIAAVTKAAEPVGISEVRLVEEPDLYYVSRWLYRPLPVILARVNDSERTRYYIDPKTASVVTTYGPRNWQGRWLYHGMHSLDFPVLYRHRPLWDIVMITFMVGGTALCVTSLILAWRVMGRTLSRSLGIHRAARAEMIAVSARSSPSLFRSQ